MAPLHSQSRCHCTQTPPAHHCRGKGTEYVYKSVCYIIVYSLPGGCAETHKGGLKVHVALNYKLTIAQKAAEVFGDVQSRFAVCSLRGHYDAGIPRDIPSPSARNKHSEIDGGIRSSVQSRP